MTTPEIETPLYSFHNIMSSIVKNFEKEFSIKNLSDCLFFNNDSMSLFGWIEIKYVKGAICLNIKKALNHSDFKILQKVYDNYIFVCREFSRYIMMYNRIAKGCDDTPFQLVDGIIEDVLTNKFSDKKYLLPFKNKLSELDKSLNIYEKYELFLVVDKPIGSQYYNFKIKKCMSSTLDETKSINNLKYFDVDTIHEFNAIKSNVKKVIEKLFYYGEI